MVPPRAPSLCGARSRLSAPARARSRRGLEHRDRGGLARRMRVSLFVTCFNDTLFPATGRAVVELLERLGHEVEFREEQTCCGQMHANAGYRAEARALADRFRRVFEGAET